MLQQHFHGHIIPSIPSMPVQLKIYLRHFELAWHLLQSKDVKNWLNSIYPGNHSISLCFLCLLQGLFFGCSNPICFCLGLMTLSLNPTAIQLVSCNSHKFLVLVAEEMLIIPLGSVMFPHCTCIPLCKSHPRSTSGTHSVSIQCAFIIIICGLHECLLSFFRCQLCDNSICCKFGSQSFPALP